MNGENLIFVMSVILFCFILILIALRFYVNYGKRIKCLKQKMDKTCDCREFLEIRRKLWITYICIIPFLKPKTVKKIYSLVALGKRHRPKERKADSLTAMLLPSFAAMVICVVCLSSGTFAWFTATQTTDTQKITAANFNITQTVNNSKSKITNNISEAGSYNLEIGEYDVILTAGGTAENGGYCIIYLNNQPFVTERFDAIGDTKTFKLTTYCNAEMRIVPQWGSFSGEVDFTAGQAFTYGEPISQAAPQNTQEKVQNENTSSGSGDGAVSTVSLEVNSGADNSNQTVSEVVSELNSESSQIQSENEGLDSSSSESSVNQATE